MHRCFVYLFVGALLLAVGSHADAVTLTFDDAIFGATSYSFDADGDSLPDAVFSTTDPLGFRTAGPGPNMTYIDEPGLEGTTTLSPDLRVDFPVGALNEASFGFAMDTQMAGTYGVTFTMYDSSDAPLASTYVLSDFTTLPSGRRSSFPEARVELLFTGTGAYGTFDFDTPPGRYIVDNFEGTFGTVERSVPEPVTSLLAVMSLSAIGLASCRRRR